VRGSPSHRTAARSGSTGNSQEPCATNAVELNPAGGQVDGVLAFWPPVNFPAVNCPAANCPRAHCPPANCPGATTASLPVLSPTGGHPFPNLPLPVPLLPIVALPKGGHPTIAHLRVARLRVARQPVDRLPFGLLRENVPPPRVGHPARAPHPHEAGPQPVVAGVASLRPPAGSPRRPRPVGGVGDVPFALRPTAPRPVPACCAAGAAVGPPALHSRDRLSLAPAGGRCVGRERRLGPPGLCRRTLRRTGLH